MHEKVKSCVCNHSHDSQLFVAIVVVLVSILGSSCFGTQTHLCGDVRCGPAQVCAPNEKAGKCVDFGSCGDGKVNEDNEREEECDDGNLIDGDGIDDRCDSNCKLTRCGNGIITLGELCDDNNTTNSDGCDSNCTPTGCGNGVVSDGEECDYMDPVSGKWCSVLCTIMKCDNGIIDIGEQCDLGELGNSESSACPFCQLAWCGDGYVQGGIEECDGGLLNSEDRGCLKNCEAARCGDGYTWAGVEGCDEGPMNSNSGMCLTNCHLASCGDGHVLEAPSAGMPAEMCDNGNNTCGTCMEACQKPILASKSTGSIIIADVGALNGGAFTLRDGFNPEVKFEFVETLPPPPLPLMPIYIENGTMSTASMVGGAIKEAIDNLSSSGRLLIKATVLNSSPPAPFYVTVRLIHKRFTDKGRRDIIQGQGSGFYVIGMNGGEAGNCGLGQPCRSDLDCSSNICLESNVCGCEYNFDCMAGLSCTQAHVCQ